MKFTALAVALGTLALGAAHADTQAEINALQQQISQLQSQSNGSVSANNGSLGQLERTVNKNVFSDYSKPFGSLPSVGLSYALLQEQDDFKSPMSVGGYLEADYQLWGGNNLATSVPLSATYAKHGSQFSLNTAKLYFLANPNDWTQAFITIDGGLNGDTTQLSEAFVTFGNLAKNPLYATFGKTYIPFGVFSGNGPWSNSLLTNAFRSGETAQVIFGFGQDGLNTSLSLFNGQNNLGDFAYSIQYGQTKGKVSYSLGAGYMNDIRNSHSQTGDAIASNGAGTSTTSPMAGSRNGALDLNMQGTYDLGNSQNIGLSGEWVTTTGTATVNGSPTGKMSAWDVAGTYTLPIYNKATSFGLSYSQTRNMQNVPLALSGSSITSPNATGIKRQWLAYASSEVMNNVYVGPEYSRQKMYNGASTWATTLDLSIYF